MPTYDYKCSNCQYKFEYFQPMNSEALTKCPRCNGELKRMIGTGAGPIFKGGGFYQTDYKMNSTENKKSSETKSESPETERKSGTAEKKKE